VRDEEGNPIRILSTGCDTTDRKLADECIKKIKAELQQRVAERTQELVKANRTLRAEMAEWIKTEKALWERSPRLRMES
jgi:C4-dicarboxylate-specific signal transduction histidine kinase